MCGDVIAAAEESLGGEPLLVPAMRGGEIVLRESLDSIRARADSQLAALPERLRRARLHDPAEPYPVEYSQRLLDSIA
jgi:hypothetical protein